MTTPRPTADQVTSPSLPDVPGLPDWLPDEATLNRLAGEFFAALPGSTQANIGVPAGEAPSFGSVRPGASIPDASGAPNPPAGGVDQAPRVDVPATANTVPRVPGGARSDTGTQQPGGGLGDVRD